jgi:uncharacterized protein (TIGR00369 family)
MNWEAKNPDWESRVRESFARQSFMRLIGAGIVELAPGRCTLALPARDDLCQQRGFLHGGVTAAIADNACGYAAYTLMPPGSTPLTVEFKINLLAPAVGERFIATGTVLKPGRTLTIVEAEVRAERNGAQTAVARMLATLMCLERTSDAAAPAEPAG